MKRKPMKPTKMWAVVWTIGDANPADIGYSPDTLHPSVQDAGSPPMTDDKKAWHRPAPEPGDKCEECEGSGMGPNRRCVFDELVDWDDCPKCAGTGRKSESPGAHP